MSYLLTSGSAEHYRNNIKAKGPVLYIVGREKITGGPVQFGFFSRRDNRFGRLETFIRSGFYFDKDNRTIRSDHNQIDFTSLTGEVASQLPEAFSYKIPLAAPFTPSAKQFPIGQ